jgi:hypothetical protein
LHPRSSTATRPRPLPLRTVQLPVRTAVTVRVAVAPVPAAVTTVTVAPPPLFVAIFARDAAPSPAPSTGRMKKKNKTEKHLWRGPRPSPYRRHAHCQAGGVGEPYPRVDGSATMGERTSTTAAWVWPRCSIRISLLPNTRQWTCRLVHGVSRPLRVQEHPMRPTAQSSRSIMAVSDQDQVRLAVGVCLCAARHEKQALCFSGCRESAARFLALMAPLATTPPNRSPNRPMHV